MKNVSEFINPGNNKSITAKTMVDGAASSVILSEADAISDGNMLDLKFGDDDFARTMIANG